MSYCLWLSLNHVVSGPDPLHMYSWVGLDDARRRLSAGSLEGRAMPTELHLRTEDECRGAFERAQGHIERWILTSIVVAHLAHFRG